jgi:cytoskeletal protein RodZ
MHMPASDTALQAPPAKALLLADTAQRKVPGRWALLWVGLLLISLFIAGVVLERTVGSETKTTPAAAATASTTTSPAKTSAPAETAATSSQKASETSTSSDTTTKALPAEGVLLALLGTGVALVLTSALYTRISAIKLPGGAEIDLSNEEKQQVSKEVAQQVAAKAAPTTTPEQLAQATASAYDLALDAARTLKLRTGGRLDAPALHKAVQVGVQHVEDPVQPEAAPALDNRNANV